jgi:hypothetical protein
MIHKSLSTGIFLLVTTMLLALGAMAGESLPPVRDRTVCAKMIRAGQQACDRGKYEEAKAYFRRAVEADPTSAKAWHHYDTSVVLALAAQLKKQQAPCEEDTVPEGTEVASPTAQAPSPPPEDSSKITSPKAKAPTPPPKAPDQGC